jgi:hypothetical protein
MDQGADDSEPPTNGNGQPPGDLATEVNQRIRATYAAALRQGRWPVALKLRWPLQYSSLRSRCVVFVGMNPSEARDFPLASADELDDERALRAVLDHERGCLGLVHGKNGHSYYRHFGRLAPSGWCHVDLFPAREKKQDAFKAALGLDNRPNWHRLSREWFDISLDLLCALQPSAVVVVNAFASELMHEEASQRWALRWNSAVGRHEAALPHGTVPFFFSGMLTGVRALDRFSRQRLAWHIERALADPPR